MKDLKFIDCNACIGYASVNREIINHERYPAAKYLKLKLFRIK